MRASSNNMQHSGQLTHGARLPYIYCVLRKAQRAPAGLETSSAAPAHHQLHQVHVVLHLHLLLGSLLLLLLLLLPGLPQQQLPHHRHQQLLLLLLLNLCCAWYNRCLLSCPTSTSPVPACNACERKQAESSTMTLTCLAELHGR
jgi:hypothetical protein